VDTPGKKIFDTSTKQIASGNFDSLGLWMSFIQKLYGT
jgi:hypothetical protein